MTDLKFKAGDYVLIKVESSLYKPREMWVVYVKSVSEDYYVLQEMNSSVNFTYKWPTAFETFMHKIEPEDVESTIKAIRVLFHAD